MSTTNQPGAGPNWPADVGHGSAPDDHGGGGGVNPEALKLGHEPDVFAVKPILSIPFAVVVTFVVGFGVAAGVFAYMAAQVKPDPLAHPEGLARGNAPLNDRLARTDQTGASGVKAEVDAPRLETLRRLQTNDKEKGVQFTSQPELPTGNSPWIHPEDIQPGRVAGLNRTEYADKEKKYARIPIDDAMKLIVEKGELRAHKGGARPQVSADRPTGANAGRGGMPAAPKVEAPAPPPGPAKLDPPKAPEKK
ncbi:MAG TPA: hypothetical protein VH092_01875 [Urbifossiella sp.]|nr:hypothetical protein [Urbifossiella sp.]